MLFCTIFFLLPNFFSGRIFIWKKNFSVFCVVKIFLFFVNNCPSLLYTLNVLFYRGEKKKNPSADPRPPFQVMYFICSHFLVPLHTLSDTHTDTSRHQDKDLSIQTFAPFQTKFVPSPGTSPKAKQTLCKFDFFLFFSFLLYFLCYQLPVIVVVSFLSSS